MEDREEFVLTGKTGCSVSSHIQQAGYSVLAFFENMSVNHCGGIFRMTEQSLSSSQKMRIFYGLLLKSIYICPISINVVAKERITQMIEDNSAATEAIDITVRNLDESAVNLYQAVEKHKV